MGWSLVDTVSRQGSFRDIAGVVGGKPVTCMEERSISRAIFGIKQMLDRIFKSESGPGPIEYVLLLMVLTVLGLAVVGNAPRAGGTPMTQKPVVSGAKG